MRSSPRGWVVCVLGCGAALTGCLSSEGSERAGDLAEVAVDDDAVGDVEVTADVARPIEDALRDGAGPGDNEVVEPEGEPGLEVTATTEGAVAPFLKVHAAIAWEGHALSEIEAVRWTVIGPLGSTRDTTGGATLEVEANLVGTWRVRAVIVDHDGVERVAKSFVITVAPPIGLYVQLSWRTPGDVNEADTGGDQIYFSVGTDVDLHLLHEKAEGEYFDWTYDTYWDNTQPEWGIFDPLDNPSLDRDDTDGAGPEAISLALPEADVGYTVGVHYWNDWGYGNSFATVRIYIDGELADEWAEVELRNDDLWTSHRIVNGRVQRVGSAPSIEPNYRDDGSLPDTTLSCAPAIVRTLPARFECRVQPGSIVLTSVHWSVTAPSGEVVLEGGESPFATNINQLGYYTVAAVLHDGAGLVLPTLTTRVLATTRPSLRVAVVWTTPGDPDPDDVGRDKSDSVGADLDLHLLHEKAQGLGDATYDCGYQNEAPEWGLFAPEDNPTFSADDFDGVGPETIEVPVIEPGVSYRAVVHAYGDHGFGPSVATVRVYVDDELVGSVESPPLSTGDTWEALSIRDGVVAATAARAAAP